MKGKKEELHLWIDPNAKPKKLPKRMQWIYEFLGEEVDERKLNKF